VGRRLGLERCNGADKKMTHPPTEQILHQFRLIGSMGAFLYSVIDNYGVERTGSESTHQKAKKTHTPRNRVRRSGSASAGNQTPVREPVHFDSSENYILPAQSHRSSLKIISLFGNQL
jgi:hypothetical protein